jgi:hypothetical protein
MQADNTTDELFGRVRILERKIQSLERALQPAARKILILIVWQGALSLVAVLVLAKVIWRL